MLATREIRRPDSRVPSIKSSRHQNVRNEQEDELLKDGEEAVGSLRQRGGLVCNGSHEKTAFAHLFHDTSKEKHMGPKWGQSWGGGQR